MRPSAEGLKSFLPTLKSSTNSDFARRMPDLIATASGDYVPKAVALGQDDFLPWKRGVSL